MTSQRSVGRRVGCVVVAAVSLALVAVACGTSGESGTSMGLGEATSSTTSTTAGPPERHLVYPDPVEWHESEPTADQMRAIVSNLTELDTWALWPPELPRDPDGDLGAVFAVGRYEPTGEVDIRISMSPSADWEVAWESGDPGPSICEGDGVQLDVRGSPGCVLDPDGDGYFLVGWTEDGHTMSIRVRGLVLDEVLTWLDTWTRLPSS